MRPTSEQYSVSPDSGMPVIPVAFSSTVIGEDNLLMMTGKHNSYCACRGKYTSD